MFAIQNKELKTADIFWKSNNKSAMLPQPESIPIIEWSCGKKKCCKKYRKAEKKRCKKCPNLN